MNGYEFAKYKVQRAGGELSVESTNLEAAMDAAYALANSGHGSTGQVLIYAPYGTLGGNPLWQLVATKSVDEFIGIYSGAETTPVGASLAGTSGVQTPTGATGGGVYAAASHTHAYSFAAGLVAIEDGSYITGITESSNASGGTITTVASVHPTSGNYAGTGTSRGLSNYPARSDHSHPLNLVDVLGSPITAATGIKPVGGTGAFGSLNYYCRLDHVHPMPTGGIGASGIGSAPPQESVASSVSASRYGNGYDATWDRDLSLDGGDGFKVSLCVGLKPVNIGGGIMSNVAFFRTFTFDKFGLVRAVSAVTHGMVTTD